MKDTVSSNVFKNIHVSIHGNLEKMSPALKWLFLCKGAESLHRLKISLSILSCSEVQKTNWREVPISLQGLGFLWMFTETQVSVALKMAYNF